MLGQLKWKPGAWGGGEERLLYGLPVFCAASDPEGPFRAFRLRRAGNTLRRSGIARVLTPAGFHDWPLLSACGLRSVSPEPLVRARAGDLALAALRRRELDPEHATVALRGNRADRDMERAAIRLCPVVRRLIISAPGGGEELARFLRREFGVPVLPPEERGDLALRFSPETVSREGGLSLFGPEPDLEGLTLTAPALPVPDRTNLPLLTALWQGGCLRAETLKIR